MSSTLLYQPNSPQETASWGFFMLCKVKGLPDYATINNILRVLSRCNKEDEPNHTHAPTLSRRSDSLASIQPSDPTSSTRIAGGDRALPLYRRSATAGCQWCERPGCAQKCGGLTRGGAGA